MPALDELETLEREIAALRTRIEEEASHVSGLSQEPALAEKAQEVIARETEQLKLLLAELEELKARVENEAGGASR